MSKINLAKILSTIIEDELTFAPRAKICLFLGAGCSISSGADSFIKLKERIINDYGLDKNEFRNELIETNNIENFFDVLFEKIRNSQTRVSILKDAFPEKRIPADGYICTALLCSVGAVNSVITTNFDQYLEQAAKSIGSQDDLYIIHTLAEPEIESLQRIAKKRTIVYKIHGDLDMGIVSLTSRELNDGTYPKQTIRLAKFLMSDHRIMFFGYSGSEKRLSRFFNRHVNNNEDIRIPEFYWVNPNCITSLQPLFGAIQDKLIQEEDSGKKHYFDEFMKSLIRYIDPRFFIGKTRLFKPYDIYAREIEKKTQTCLDVQDYLSFEDPRYIKRNKLIKDIIEISLKSNSLLMLIGPSGYGKSSLMPALINYFPNWKSEINCTVCLKVGGEFRPQLSFEEVFAQSVGIDSISIPTLSLMQSDLEKKNTILLVIIDGLDQARASIDETKLLFRDISRFHSSLLKERLDNFKIIITCRSEVWRAISSKRAKFRIDLKNTHEIEIGKYSGRDAEAAFKAYSEYFHVRSSLKELSPETRALLSEPILLRLICKTYAGQELPLSLRLHQIFENYLRSCLDKHQDFDVLPFLEKIAVKWLDPRISRDGCSFSDLPRIDGMGSLLDIALRSGILRESQKAGMDYYAFFHERILELFIYRYLMSHFETGLAFISFTHDDLLETLSQHSESKHIKNVIKLFLTSPRTRGVLRGCIEKANIDTRSIISECILMVSQSDPEDYSNLFIEWYFSTADSKIKSILIQAAASSRITATKLWDIIDQESIQASSLTLSAIYFLVDTQRQELENNRDYEITLEYLQSYFILHNEKPNLSVLLCLYLIARCAPHKLSNLTVNSLYKSAIEFITNTLKKAKIPEKDTLKNILENYGPRYLFNSGYSDLHIFLNRPAEARDIFNQIIDLINSCPDTVDDALCESILSLTNERSNRIEKLLLQPIFILIARNDFEAYKKIIIKLLENCTTRSEADFCSGSVAYQYAANDQFEHSFSYRINEFSLKEHPEFLRSEESYEILFNPIATYGFTYPLVFKGENIDLFEEYIACFLKENDYGMILRMLHALRQTLSLAPDEGLHTLEPILQCREQIVRERLVRVLAEGYAICPTHISKFVYSKDELISVEEIKKIFTEREHNLHQHPITILEWGRVYRFLLFWNDSPEDWRSMLKAINHSSSLKGIIQAITFVFLGLQTR